MWWFVKKIIDTGTTIRYSYGFESKEQTGIIEYNKDSQDFQIIKVAENDNLKLAERFLYRQLYNLIHNENCPKERQITIG